MIFKKRKDSFLVESTKSENAVFANKSASSIICSYLVHS